jgi:hypothetical protein
LNGSVQPSVASSARWVGVLLVLVAVRFLAQALFVPSFEGPDELFHLARIAAFADEPLGAAFKGVATDRQTIAAVQARPCCASLHRHFGCRLFGRETAFFNLLRPLPPAVGAPAVQNPEDNQPPLYYALVGSALRLAGPVLGDRGRWPEVRLLIARLIGVVSVIAGLTILLRLLVPGGEWMVAAGLLVWMLMPGASESLARCSNDAPVFLWSAGALAAAYRRASTATIAALATAGPLLKLTAFPTIAFIVVMLWVSKRRTTATFAGVASLLVFPVQALRGWQWGGTIELNRPASAFDEGAWQILVGVGRSTYTFFKTAFWLGNWSFFRPPMVLLTVFWIVLLLWVVSAQYRPGSTLVIAHGAAATACALGALLFFLSHRRFWGDWGGVGGWYLWAWFPWLTVAARDLLSLSPHRRPLLLSLTVVLALAATVVYLHSGLQVYGARS